MSKKRFTQTSIRTLLLVTMFSAVAVAIWLNRPIEPNGELLIEIGQNGQIELDGSPTKNEDLLEMLSRKSNQHEKWNKKCSVIIRATPSTPTSTVQNLIADAQSAGLEDFSLRVMETNAIKE